MSKSIIYIICFILLSMFGHIHAQANVACIGNSITQGIGLTDPGSTSYPSQLAVRLGSGYTVTNYGEAGRTALDVDEWSYILSPEWTYSKATPHDVVIILLGTNDSREEYWTEYANFKDDYLYIMNSYKNYPGSDDPVFIIGLPPPVFDESKGHRNAPIVNDIIPRIKQLANETDATIADFYNALAGKPELFMDGVHPNEVGAGIMAEVAYNAIQKAIYTADPPPDTPTGLKTIPGLTNIKLEWHANTEDDLFSYRIFRSFNKGGVQDYIGEILKPDTTFIDNSVVLNHIYYYSIDAKDVHNNASARTVAVAGKTLDNIPPSAPQNLQAILSADSVKINWTPNSEPDLEKYHIYRNTNQSELQNAASIIGTIHAPKSDFIDISFNSATHYYYGVKAVDISGNQGLISNIVNITTKSRPLSSDTTITFYEDVPHQFTASDFPFTDADNHTLDKIIFIESAHNEFFSYDNDTIGNSFTCNDISKLLFTADSNEFGDNYTAFAFKVVDSFGSTSLDTNIVIINVELVNDAPTFDPIEDLFTIEDSSAITLTITGMSYGPENEMQNLFVFAYPDDTTRVKIGDINYSSKQDTGWVTIHPIENAFGTIPITIKIFDNGGTAFGGTDFTEAEFNLNIAPINDPPIFNLPDNIQIFEDSETTIELTGIQAGPWETDQQIIMSVTSDNTDILPHPELEYSSPDTSATLTFSTIPNIFGSSSITIAILDNGGTDFGGKDSTSYIIYVNISPINDPPTFNLLDDIQIVEDSETIVELTGIQAGSWETDQQIMMSVRSNNTDILPHPELSYNSPDTIATLTFSTIPNVFGSSSITIIISDNGGTDFGGKDSTSYIIPVEITSVNDTPSNFNIITPNSDSTLVINKSNYLTTFSIGWEPSYDIENDDISYDIIFSADLSALSRYGLNSTKTDYILKEILATTDTVSIASGAYSVIASDGDLQTDAINSGLAITVDGRSFAPAKLHLDQNYPNPFNRATVIGFDMPKHAKVSLIIYDLLGEEIIKLIDNKKYERGYNTITWNGLDKNNNIIAAGIYLMQIRMGAVEQHKKLIFLK